MTQKGRAIQLQKSTATDLMSHLANLAEYEKGPNDPVSLPEVFRTKKYMAEIRRTLEKVWGCRHCAANEVPLYTWKESRFEKTI